MTKYYFDSCIWRDYFENRADRFRPLGERAFKLTKKIIQTGSHIIYSDLVVEELRKYYSEERIRLIFSLVPVQSCLKAPISQKQTKEAISISRALGIPRKDVLHSIIARDNDAIMITRYHHYDELKKMIEIYKPEDLI